MPMLGKGMDRSIDNSDKATFRYSLEVTFGLVSRDADSSNRSREGRRMRKGFTRGPKAERACDEPCQKLHHSRRTPAPER